MSEEASIQPPTKGKRRIFAVVAGVIVVLVVAFAVYWFFFQPQGIPWLFRGAYAKYHGETTVLFVTVKLDLRLEVVDYNATHAKMLMYVKMETPFGSQEFQNVTWSDLTKKSYEVEGYDLKRTYEQETYVEGIGTRTCVIYEYESKTSPGTLMIMYVDKNVGWPIKMRFTSEATQNMPSMSLDLNLTESNIPGFKK
ncbi:MAG: hypothetical protein ACPLYF_03475 [Fervidobacterium sp.]